MTNTVLIAGRLGAAPESRNTTSGKVVGSMSVATSRPKRDSNGKVLRNDKGYAVEETEWHRVTMFGKTAEFAAKHLDKGAMVSVTGSIHYSKWTDKEGVVRYSTEILADKLEAITFGKED